jgi:4-hydroxy-4-methyl-2-oxoglutarate aldolase
VTTTVASEQLDALRAYDTPTLANAIGGLVSRPANEGYTRPPVHNVLPALPAMVGRAVTLTIRSEVPFDRPDGNATAMLPLYDAVAQVEGPKVVVVQDLDGGTGCLWGEVNSSICLAAGCEGVVTDGLVRDLPDVEAMGFRLLARGVGVARAWVDVVETNIPVTVGGVTFEPGAVVHADRHGALLIPEEAVAGLPAAADAVMAREATLLDWVRSNDFDVTQVAARRAQH